ncbi:uncharacterized protein LOC127651998 [Xyrauchen texanus]|uniref:uncharacterized protein LOC127651998 n=1 Tax=Xyrauchen texanus TaxID=154827 RepID=UPI002241AB26|nr:uncharacterized protein LOC127651998 [Xyrauchen texanus]
MIFIKELNTTDAGSYRMGFNNQRFIEITLNVKEDSCCGKSKTVTVNSGKTAEFSCEYSQNHKYNRKTIFKEEQNSINEEISSIDTWKKKGRFSISDDRDKHFFIVRITDVKPDDGGVYLCAVQIYRHSYSYSIITTTVHLHIMNKVGSYRVSGYSGGQIIIKCEHPQYKTNPKYICKESDEGCSDVKSAGVENKWMENGNVSLYDDTRGGVLMVFFRDLNAGDAGTYRCGVNVSQYTDRVTQVTLDIKDDTSLVKKTMKSVYVGEEVNIICQIPEEHEVSSTHFCKEDDDHICQTVTTSEVTQMSSLSERNEARVFTVSISNLTVRDAGVYWCGTQTSGEHLTFISLTTEVQLKLINKVGSYRVSGYSGGQIIIKCEHPQYKTNPKYICKESDEGCSDVKSAGVENKWMENGNVSLYDDTRGGVLMVFFRDLNAGDAGTYRCGVNVSQYTDRVTQVTLDIKDDTSLVKKTMKSVYVGEEVNIICQIPEEHEVSSTHFCKEDDDHICQTVTTSEVTQMSSLSERNEARVFTVSISNLTVRDAGVYWCGTQTSGEHLTFISLTTEVQLKLINKVGSYRVSGYSGGQIIIKCEHPQYKTNPKYICKESDEGCSDVKSAGVENKWMENGNVSLYDDTRGGVLMVFFRDLNAGDAGTYRCGVNVSQYTDRVTQVTLDIKDDASLVKKTMKSVYVGEEVNIICQIPEEHEVSSTHFCKEDDDHICQTVTTSEVTQMSSLSERNEARVFTVSISNLTVRDAGVYWCGTQTSGEHLTSISLMTNIQLALTMPSVYGYEGESAKIICPYDPIYKSKSKYLCKGKCSTRDRNPLIETVRDQNETKTDRLTLNDDITASVFTVTITGLTAEDAGKYCCAMTLERGVNYLCTHLIIIRKQELILNQSEGDDISIKCKHHEEHQTFFCKGHQASMCVKDGVSLERIRDDGLSLSDEASTGVFTVNITDLRQEDSGIYWCGSDAVTKVILEVKKNVSDKIIAGICVALLLMGGLVLLLYKFRNVKTPDRSSSTDRREMRSGQVSHAACEYENIKDLRQHSVSHPEETVLYDNVKIPTNSSDPHMLYSTVQLPSNPFNRHEVLYSTANFPSNSSDELLYSAVSFQKHEDSLTDDTVTFRKEEH